jgi:hypothetical protein
MIGDRLVRSGCVVALLALAFLAQRTKAEESATAPTDQDVVLLFPSLVLGNDDGVEAPALGTALEDALRNALEKRSFRVSEAPEALQNGPDVRLEVIPRALAAGARWAAVASFEIEDKRLSYTLSVYDAKASALIASAGFSTYAGITSLPLMDSSALTVASKTAAYRDAPPPDFNQAPIPYRISLISHDEGASVYIGEAGSPGSRLVGTIKEGSLLIPYIPFKKGTKIILNLTDKNKRPVCILVELGAEPPTIVAPALAKPEKENFLLGTGPGRLLGLGGTYRVFFRPDWSFFFVNERIFAGYDFSSSSSPLWHFETWEGLGWYLVFPPESRFRAGACVGWGLLASLSSASSPTSDNSLFMDYALLPIELFFEYRVGAGPSVFFSYRSAYSVSSSGLLGRGWMDNNGPDLTLGVLWRR